MNNDQQIGSLLARVDSLEDLEQRIDNRLKAMQTDISDIQLTLAGATGSWRALLAIGSAIAALSASVGAMVHWFVSKS